jgi:hypothetical protein
MLRCGMAENCVYRATFPPRTACQCLKRPQEVPSKDLKNIRKLAIYRLRHGSVIWTFT